MREREKVSEKLKAREGSMGEGQTTNHEFLLQICKKIYLNERAELREGGRRDRQLDLPANFSQE